MLPADTRHFLDMREWPALLAEFKTTAYASALAEPSIRRWLETIDAFKMGREMADELHLLEALQIAQRVDGQLVVGVVPDKEAFLFLADCHRHAAEIRLLIDTVLFKEFGPDPDSAAAPIDEEAIRGLRERIFVDSGLLIVSNRPEIAREALARAQSGEASGFRQTGFYRALERNVERPRLMLAFNLMSTIADAAGRLDERALNLLNFWGALGLDYLLVSPDFTGLGMKQAARIGFIENGRYGVLDWMADPAPMRGMDFFSSDIHIFASAIARSPRRMLADLMLLWSRPADQKAREQADWLRKEHGAWLDSFGGEVAIGIDNPVLPVPNIKIAVELADQAEFELGMNRHLNRIVQALDAEGKIAYLVDSEHKGRIIHTLTVDGLPIRPSYAVVEDYAVFGPGPQFVRNSIDVFDSGRSIGRDPRLLQLLPSGAGAEFSFLAYQDIARAIPNLMRSKLTPKLTEEERAWIPQVDFLERYRAPGVIYGYARPSSIDVYLNTPSGIDFNMGMAVPFVAQWLAPKLSIGPALDRYVAAQSALETLKQAALQYKAAHGRLPKSLAETAEFLADIPEDPFGTMRGDRPRFAEGRQPGEIVFYSIGPDGVDDGGAIEYDPRMNIDGIGDVILRLGEESRP
ncbi:MAG: hypothetical protein BWZ10_01243 [candidate division BRC1 bacterium ADurb.BinA364]|nr:MAG: hypothetical protein BWZ10_01243 [candidate division BRC1 bacterium ADurb.BinA364]